MAIKDTHGVVVAYYGVELSGLPAFHRLNGCQWGRKAMRSEAWELYPSAEIAREAGVGACRHNACFGNQSKSP